MALMRLQKSRGTAEFSLMYVRLSALSTYVDFLKFITKKVLITLQQVSDDHISVEELSANFFSDLLQSCSAECCAKVFLLNMNNNRSLNYSLIA